MTTSLPVADIVTVTVSVSPAAPQARGFGTMLILGSTANLPLYSRIRTYGSLIGGVDADFASNTPEYQAAQAYFSQNPAPALVKIGRQFVAAQAGALLGGPASQLLSAYTAITAGGFDIAINGVNEQVSGLNFSGAASLTAVAALIQTALQSLVASTLCTYNTTTKQFVITSPTTGVSSTIGYALPPTHSGSPTDVSTLLALTNVAGAFGVTGIAIESMTAALTASAAFDPGWYGLALTSAVVQDVKDAAAWTEAGVYIFFNTIADANAESAAATSDLAYFMANLGYNRTAMFFDNVNSTLFESASAMAKLFAVDYTQPNSFITLKFKQAPGFAPVPLTETQRLALIGKNCNYYANFGGPNPMFAEGTVANGRFMDEVIGLDWLQAQIQNAIFTLLYTTPTKIPQTDKGAQRLVAAATVALEAARTAGLLAPGFWTGPPVGSVNTGDYLEKGYYVFAQPVANQSASDRGARKAPPLSAIGIGAGAIHSSAVGFVFQR